MRVHSESTSRGDVYYSVEDEKRNDTADKKTDTGIGLPVERQHS